jgi:PIN domain nuclease of toxin-antitoxin system
VTLLLLDTHVLIWYMDRSRRLGARCQRAIARSLERDEVLVSAASFCEIAQLMASGRLPGNVSSREVRRRALSEGVSEAVINGEQAIDTAGIGALRDPMDRFIVAAARHRGATLVTADASILKWPGEAQRMDATE